MKRLISVFLLSTPAFAATDYQCVSDCTQKGYLYQFCQSQCSYNDRSRSLYQTPKVERVDYACLSDCTAKGYQYAYCKSRCTY